MNRTDKIIEVTGCSLERAKEIERYIEDTTPGFETLPDNLFTPVVEWACGVLKYWELEEGRQRLADFESQLTKSFQS